MMNGLVRTVKACIPSGIFADIRKIAADEDGATVIEYVLITALIGVALIAGFTALQENVSNTLSTVGSAIR